MPEQVAPPERPDISQNVIEIKGFRGLNVRPDIVNRPQNSWRRLDNFDLYIPGSIRKIAGPTKYKGPFPVVILAHAEFRATDSAAVQDFGVGTDGNLYDLSNAATPGISLGLGAISDPVFMALMPGVLIPYSFITWAKSLGVLTTQAVSMRAKDGQLYVFQCTVAGSTSSTSPPTWPTGGTVVDGSVTWTNRGLQNQKTYLQNYLVIIVPGQQPVKFDGVNVTQIGVSAPTIPINIINGSTRSDGGGIAPSTGYYYAWTWFNPKTLHESAPSPIVGSVSANKANRSPNVGSTPPGPIIAMPVIATDIAITPIVLTGAFLGPASSGSVYSQIGLSIPLAYLTPPVGSEYTHVRFYRTKDGGSQLYLLQTLYSVAGDVLTDANGAVKISQLSTQSGYEAVPITQVAQTVCVIYDGIDDGQGYASQDSISTNNDLLAAGNAANLIHLNTGTLTVDTDQAAHLYPRGAWFATSLSIAGAQGTSWSLEVRFRTTDTVGGVLASMSDTQLGPTATPLNSDRYLFMTANGHIHFAYRNPSGGWLQLSYAVACNDGANHSIDVVGSGAGVVLYVDGVSRDSNAATDNPTWIGYWHFGWGDIGLHPNITNQPSSPYFQGNLDEIAFWQTFALSGANVANNQAQAIANANYSAVIIALSPTSYWRLDDLSLINAKPQIDAALVFPSPALTDHFPPPEARWGAVFQGSLIVQDSDDQNLLWPSDVGDFESFGEFQNLRIQNEYDDNLTALVGGLNLLIVATQRRVDGITGSEPSGYSKQPVDSLHGFLGKRCVFPLGSKIIGLMRQGFAAFDLNLSFGATSGNIQLGYGDASLIGDDILSILQGIPQAALDTLICIAVDNTQNIILFAIKDANGVTYNDVVLMYTLGAAPGWSKYLPATEYTTVRETLLPDSTIKMLADGSDKSVYELFQDYSSTPLTAVAETQALPVPEQTGPEFWDTDRRFLYFYVEGQDLANFTYSFAVDYPNNSTFVGPIPLQAGKNLLGASGKQIVIRFSHSVAPTTSPPLISYIKLYFTLLGRTS